VADSENMSNGGQPPSQNVGKINKSIDATKTDKATRVEKLENDEVIARARDIGIRFIDMQFTDIFGSVKTVTIPISQLSAALENGVWFDGSSIEGLARIAEHDMYLVPDTSTFTVLPWSDPEIRVARLICWVYTPRGERFPGDPRHVLDKLLKEAAALGYLYNTAPELEFFLFKKDLVGGLPVTEENDRAGYFDHSNDSSSSIKQKAAYALTQMGIEFDSFHHEIAPGQHELDFSVNQALRSADHVITAKSAIKAVARQNNLRASFMPKPLFGIPGSGMHTHQSLIFNGEQGQRNGANKVIPAPSSENVFAGLTEQYGLSPVARHFIAGQLYHAKGMAVVLAPIVNSYKRLVAGYEAPVYISWARVNRGALIRVPHSGPGPNHKYAARLELRCPDPACNPYLAYAAMLKAGLDGIKRKLPLPEPVEESIYQFDASELRRRNIETLPSTLREALDDLKHDDVIQEALGDHVYENLVEAKMEEWAEFRRHISPWEVDRYLDLS